MVWAFSLPEQYNHMDIRTTVIKAQGSKLPHISYTTATDYVSILNPL